MSPIWKRGNIYWLDLCIDGKRIRQSLGESEYLIALNKAREIERGLRGRESNPAAVPFAEIKKKYLEWAWGSKPASADREEQRLKKIEALLAGQGIQTLDQITPFHLDQLKARLRERGLEKTTVNRYLQLLRCLFYRAMDWGDFPGPNPLKKIKFYREEYAIRALTPDQMKHVMRAAKEISIGGRTPLQRAFFDITLMAINTGMRRGELLGLRWKDIRGAEAIVRGKREKTRVVPLNAAALDVLRRQPRRSEYVFDIPGRSSLSILRRSTEAVREITGIDFSLHDCRHFFATQLLGAGVDLVTIAEILGHSRSTVSLIYSHTDPERKKQAVERLGEFKP